MFDKLRPYLVGICIGLAMGHFISTNYFPRIIEKPIEIVKKELVPQILEKKINVPYEVTKEIIREIEVAKPTDKPVPDPDKVVKVTDENKTYNITLDRKKEVGFMVTNNSIGILAGYAPNNNVSYKAFVGQQYKGGLEVGAGMTFRFK